MDCTSHNPRLSPPRRSLRGKRPLSISEASSLADALDAERENEANSLGMRAPQSVIAAASDQGGGPSAPYRGRTGPLCSSQQQVAFHSLRRGSRRDQPALAGSPFSQRPVLDPSPPLIHAGLPSVDSPDPSPSQRRIPHPFSPSDADGLDSPVPSRDSSMHWFTGLSEADFRDDPRPATTTGAARSSSARASRPKPKVSFATASAEVAAAIAAHQAAGRDPRHSHQAHALRYDR